ncbi:hypothetical protein HYW20_00910 [Candidatus Woesearchaeota archaeon]|nr:hypothetical protein [Candidatus Woesearchaeota archaeon]
MKLLPILALFVALLSYFSFAQQPECDYAVEILADGEEFQKEDFTWRMMATKVEGKSTNMTGTAKIEDSSGSAVKTYKPWTSDSISKQKTSSKYTPNLKPGEYEIIAEISVECDDTSKDNNIDTKKITISGDAEETKPKEEKKEDASQDTKDGDIPQNNIKTAAVKDISQTNDQIETKTAQKTKTSTQKSQQVDNVIQLTASNNRGNQKSQIKVSEIQKHMVAYESSSEKAKSLIMIFLLTLSVLLNIVLILRR